MHRSPINAMVAPSTSFSLRHTHFLIACLTASRPLVRPCLCSQDSRSVMQLKKHNSKTPPERKPKWLRKGIALLTAIATLATGGIIASTAYAGGGGGNETAGEGGTPSKSRDVWWTYKDWNLSNPSDPTSGSFGSAATDAPVYAAFQSAGISVDNQGPTKITDAAPHPLSPPPH